MASAWTPSRRGRTVISGSASRPAVATAGFVWPTDPGLQPGANGGLLQATELRPLSFPHFSHRAFRRCFITRAIELGVDFKTLAGWQGHKDGSALTAQTYSHLRTEHSDRMAEKMVGKRPKAG
jgi:hypothetical protein